MTKRTITKQVRVGDEVSVQATSNTGYAFTEWTSSGSQVSTSNPYTFTPNSNTSIDAVFSEVQPIISWVGTPGNLVIKNSNGQTHNLWSGAGTNKYFGDVEGFGADDIVSVWISGNDPDGTSRLIEHTWLTELNLSGLTHLTLGQRSFANCTTLTTVVLPTSSYSIASINGSLSNHAGAFQGCTALSSLTLGGCTSIGAYAFYGCGALRTVNIPGSCTTIGTDAFYNAGISTITLAEGIQTIGDYAFANNYRMTAISFPSTLSSYGTSAFQGCYGLATVGMNNNSGTYYRASGNCLYEISGRSVVLGCKTSTIPTSSYTVNRIGAGAFNEMIKSGANVNLTIPSNITSIGGNAFYGCNGLTGVSFSGSGLTTLMSYAFYNCTGLTTITLPSSFSYFGTSSSSTATYCFGGCTNLATVYMNSISTPPTIYRGVGTDTVSISLFPSTIQKIYIKPGTMSSYQADTNGWSYWYNQKKLYIGVGISSDVSPAGSSTVSTSSNNVEFQSDSAAPVVILTATPNTGYTFSSWKRGATVLSSSNPYTATVVDDGTGTDEFTALSTVNSYTISASVNPSASGSISGTGTYNYGASCTLVATAATGYEFVNWTENGTSVSTNSTYTFTATQNRTLVANFQVSVVPLTIKKTYSTRKIYLKNNNDETVQYSYPSSDRVSTENGVYTYEYKGDITGFELNNLKSIYYGTSYPSYDVDDLLYIDASGTSITEIPSYGFSRCTNLEYVKLPLTYIKVNTYTFYKCSSLTTFIGYGIKSINGSGFRECTSITAMYFPSLGGTSSITYGEAWRGCTSLTTLWFGCYYTKSHWGLNTYPSYVYLNFSTANYADIASIQHIYFDYDSPAPQVASGDSTISVNATKPNSSYILHIDEDIWDDRRTQYTPYQTALGSSRLDKDNIINLLPNPIPS